MKPSPPPQQNRFGRLRRIGAVAAVIILGTAVAVAIGYRRLSPVVEPTAPAAPTAGGSAMVIDGIQQTAARDGVTEWVLNARSGTFLQAEKKFLLEEPRVTFFRPGGQTFFLSARHGSVATDSHDMEAEGDVVVWNDRYRVRTERVHYVHADRLIESDRPVAITADRREITAAAGSVDLQANRMRLEGEVRGEIPAESGGNGHDAVRVASDRLLVDLDADSAEFSGRARFTEKNTVTSADSITVYTAPRQGRSGTTAADLEAVAVDRVVARGRVVIQAENSTAEAEEAVYEPDTGALTLTGRHAELRSPSVTLRGQRVVVSMRTNEMTAEGGPAGRVSVVWTPSGSRP
ncbi:MAG: LPS export ABC transporter periplasmic protein LptC [Desulfobacterales bacterium]